MSIYGHGPTAMMPTMGQSAPMGQGQPPAPPPPGALLTDDAGGDPNYRRNEVISRMVMFNQRQASKAWDSRRAEPACPHGVAFLYHEPGIGGTPFDRVRAATAMFDADEDAFELPRLLYRLIKVAEGHGRDGRFEPAWHIGIHRDEPSTPGAARLFGIAVSTLDTPTATWAEQQHHAQDESDIGGRCVILLAEKPPIHHGFIVVERGAPRSARYDLIIRANVELSYQLGMSARPWQRVQSMAELLVEDEVWQLLYRLHLAAFEQSPRPTL
jgi:hypothetical protein